MAGTSWEWAITFEYRVDGRPWTKDMAGVMGGPADATSDRILAEAVKGCLKEEPGLKGARITKHKVVKKS